MDPWRDNSLWLGNSLHLNWDVTLTSIPPHCPLLLLAIIDHMFMGLPKFMSSNGTKLTHCCKNASCKTSTMVPTLFSFFLEHKSRVATWLFFDKVERRFHDPELNRQPFHVVFGYPMHYHSIVQGRLEHH